VLPVVSSAVFLSVRPSLIAVGFSSSSQLLSRGFSFRHDSREGGRWKEGEEGRGRRREREKKGEGEEGRGRRREREKKGEGEEVGKHALLIKLQA
jgi:hypothetical protein